MFNTYKTKKALDDLIIKGLYKKSGGELLGRSAARAVPSALKSLPLLLRLAVFGMGTGVTSSQSQRPISTGKLNTLLCLHIRPINLVVFKGSSAD